MDRMAVSGANAEFGRGVVEALLRHRDPASIIATVRDPARAHDLSDRGVTVRPGDFDDASTLAASFAGAATVLINATFFGQQPELRGARVATAIRSAVAAGASRLVVTTWPEADTCPLDLTRDFLDTERLVRTSGPNWTILRLGYGIADSIARDVSWALRSGRLDAPAADAHCVPAAVPDLIDATALVLLNPDHDGRCYELSGPRAVSWTELAELATSIAGRPIEYHAISEDTFRTQLRDLGLPQPAATGLLAYYAAFRSGWGNQPHPDLATLLGRPAQDTLDAIRQRVPVPAP